jgi:hypothetical protein
MSQQAFGDYFKIPRNTIRNWEQGVRECNEYILELIEYKLKNEGMIKPTIDYALAVGYELVDGKLVINEQKAEKIQKAYDEYLDSGIVSRETFLEVQEIMKKRE